jgi:hypothetical protein
LLYNQAAAYFNRFKDSIFLNNSSSMPSTIVLITGENIRRPLKKSSADVSGIGANSGVGFETAKVIACASGDFHVIVASRTLEKHKKQ